jgi:hypothetical protein
VKAWSLASEGGGGPADTEKGALEEGWRCAPMPACHQPLA